MLHERDHRVIDVAIAGFGGVARALTRFLAATGDEGPTFRVVAVSDSSGCIVERDGMSADRLLALVEAKEGGHRIGTGPGAAKGRAALVDALRGAWPAVLVEAGPTDLAGGGESKDRVVAALEGGASVALASKGPVASAWDELVRAAGGEAALERRLRFSATVGGGMPVIDAGRSIARGSPIRGISACLNGTSNLVLGLMEEGLTLERALDQARGLGMAEADPSADIDGHDAGAKLCILSHAVMGLPLEPSKVERESIRDLTCERVADAVRRGVRIRAVGRVERGAAVAAVRLEEVSATSPFAVKGGICAVIFDGERTGELALIGRGAGPVETASAILRDLRVLAGASVSALP